MRIRNRLSIIALVVSFLIVPKWFVIPAHACPPYETQTVYYDTCGPNKTEIGWRDRNCGCATFGDGSTAGNFKQVTTVDCDYPYGATVEFFARCSALSPWVEVSGYNDCAPGC